MNKSIMKAFKKLFKGNKGEEEVLNSIVSILRKNGDNNYYLIPKATFKDINASIEIDLLLLHYVFGLYVIEVKNWESLNLLNKLNPFEQANNYQDFLLSLLESHFKKIPINVEYRVVFPQISRREFEDFCEKNPYYKNFENHAFFKEDLENTQFFKRFFNSTKQIIPNRKEFLELVKLIVPSNKIEKKKIIPIITQNEVIFFDQKQLSVLNSYSGGFRIIRGVAGTGKTVILVNFVANKLNDYPDEKFLILCFNSKLANDIKDSFSKNQLKNIGIYSIFQFLNKINFDFDKIGITDKTSLNDKYKLLETTEALKEFRSKFREYLKINPIDYFLADEVQDLPPGIVRMIYEEIKDVILFIDEAQKFYPYSMDSIADVFHHPKFKEKISMRGRVRNLKNVYRTPSNIAKCAFEILSYDKKINDYYKKAFYLKDNFLNDINFILEDGKIEIDNFDDYNKFKNILKSIEEDTIILTHTNYQKNAIEKIVKEINKNFKVLTMASVKGLEAQNVIIHSLGSFMKKTFENERDIFYRKMYVLLTRAKEKLVLSIDKEKIKDISECLEIIEILEKYERKTKNIIDSSNEEKIKLAKIKPVLSGIKEGADFIVTTSELFLLVAKLLNF